MVYQFGEDIIILFWFYMNQHPCFFGHGMSNEGTYMIIINICSVYVATCSMQCIQDKLT